ncbi:MAG TPA: DUF2752 domain-containing protein [Phycisphaerae bacterium]|nr:DUF2752 domain-containing protein [Phycisphaerae bacterium]
MGTDLTHLRSPTECMAGARGADASLPARLSGAAAALGCVAAFWAAGLLAPSSEGFGTHRQLGLPYCSFLARTGWPCPTCGLTTSMSAAARGRIAAAWAAQPFGVLVMAGIWAIGAAGAAQLATGRELLRRARPRVWWIWAGAGALLGGWAWKLAAGAISGRLPLR